MAEHAAKPVVPMAKTLFDVVNTEHELLQTCATETKHISGQQHPKRH
jgi:hypothetical protein